MNRFALAASPQALRPGQEEQQQQDGERQERRKVEEEPVQGPPQKAGAGEES